MFKFSNNTDFFMGNKIHFFYRKSTYLSIFSFLGSGFDQSCCFARFRKISVKKGGKCSQLEGGGGGTPKHGEMNSGEQRVVFIVILQFKKTCQKKIYKNISNMYVTEEGSICLCAMLL